MENVGTREADNLEVFCFCFGFSRGGGGYSRRRVNGRKRF
jgi:hypothetical protein